MKKWLEIQKLHSEQKDLVGEVENEKSKRILNDVFKYLTIMLNKYSVLSRISPRLIEIQLLGQMIADLKEYSEANGVVLDGKILK